MSKSSSPYVDEGQVYDSLALLDATYNKKTKHEEEKEIQAKKK
jgi:hypothetical protein